MIDYKNIFFLNNIFCDKKIKIKHLIQIFINMISIIVHNILLKFFPLIKKKTLKLLFI